MSKDKEILDSLNGLNDEAKEIMFNMIKRVKKKQDSINKVTDDVKREFMEMLFNDFLNRGDRFLANNFKPEKKKDGVHRPRVVRGEVIEANLTGTGRELNDKHYCIVLYEDPIKGTVVVVPLTSKIYIEETPDNFILGKLNVKSIPKKDSIALIHNTQTISRRAIRKLDTQFVKHLEKVDHPQLNEPTFKRILDGIATTFLGFETLESHVMNTYSLELFQNIHTYKMFRFKGIQTASLDLRANILTVIFWDDLQPKTFQMIKPNEKKLFTKEEREIFFENLRSIDPLKKKEAVDWFKEKYL